MIPILLICLFVLVFGPIFTPAIIGVGIFLMYLHATPSPHLGLAVLFLEAYMALMIFNGYSIRTRWKRHELGGGFFWLILILIPFVAAAAFYLFICFQDHLAKVE